MSTDGGVSLCPAVLADNPAGMAFGEAILLPDAFNRLTAPFGAYKFSRGNVLQYLLLKRQIGDKTLEANVLPFQVLHPFRLSGAFALN
jgi:hypothetical protein